MGSEARQKARAKRVRGMRLKPNVVVRDPSPHYSSRYGPITSIVVHATVSHQAPHSSSDLAAIGNVFHSREASAHVCTDADGNSARYVNDGHKAWHCVAFNSPTLGVEQISMATESTSVWKGPYRKELRETARWIARWSIRHGIPIRRGQVSGDQITKTGVLTHSQLGAAGGGHTDPGSGYPLDYVLWLARGFKAALLITRRHRD